MPVNSPKNDDAVVEAVSHLQPTYATPILLLASDRDTRRPGSLSPAGLFLVRMSCGKVSTAIAEAGDSMCVPIAADGLLIGELAGGGELETRRAGFFAFPSCLLLWRDFELLGI
jgi:hypothetical protein